MLAECAPCHVAASPSLAPPVQPQKKPLQPQPDVALLLSAPGAGLYNLGNSCFMNSVLQGLTHAPPFANFCLRSGHRSTCKAPKPCIACLLEEHVAEALTQGAGGGDDDVVTPIALHRHLPTLSSNFVPGRQEDAHEFFVMLLDAAERHSLGRGDAAVPPRPPGQPPVSYIGRLFEGTMCSQVRCCQCGHRSVNRQPFTAVPLDVADNDSLQEALAAFARRELLHGSNQYRCDHCKALTDAEKSQFLERLGPIVVFHLKRFDGPLGGKLRHRVRFPLRLDLREWGSDDDVERWKADRSCERPAGVHYSCVGVIVHRGGSARSGHYCAYVKTRAKSGKALWFDMDDSSVTPEAWGTVRDDQAYMLFYMRVDDSDYAASADPLAREAAVSQGGGEAVATCAERPAKNGVCKDEDALSTASNAEPCFTAAESAELGARSTPANGHDAANGHAREHGPAITNAHASTDVLLPRHATAHAHAAAHTNGCLANGFGNHAESSGRGVAAHPAAPESHARGLPGATSRGINGAHAQGSAAQPSRAANGHTQNGHGHDPRLRAQNGRSAPAAEAGGNTRAPADAGGSRAALADTHAANGTPASARGLGEEPAQQRLHLRDGSVRGDHARLHDPRDTDAQPSRREGLPPASSASGHRPAPNTNGHANGHTNGHPSSQPHLAASSRDEAGAARTAHAASSHAGLAVPGGVLKRTFLKPANGAENAHGPAAPNAHKLLSLAGSQRANGLRPKRLLFERMSSSVLAPDPTDNAAPSAKHRHAPHVKGESVRKDRAGASMPTSAHGASGAPADRDVQVANNGQHWHTVNGLTHVKPAEKNLDTASHGADAHLDLASKRRRSQSPPASSADAVAPKAEPAAARASSPAGSALADRQDKVVSEITAKISADMLKSPAIRKEIRSRLERIRGEGHSWTEFEGKAGEMAEVKRILLHLDQRLAGELCNYATGELRELWRCCHPEQASKKRSRL